MYEFTSLFYYKFQFLAELIIAELLFTVHLKRRSHFTLRCIGSLLLASLLTFAIPIVSYDPYYMAVIFSLIFVVSVFAFYFCFDESFINILFCSIAGYTVQHIAFSFYQFFMIATLLDGGNSLNMYGSGASIEGVVSFISFYVYVIFYTITYIVSYATLGKTIKKEKDFYVKNYWLFILLIIVVIVAILLNSIMIDICDAKKNQAELLISFSYGIISCTTVLLLQFKLKEAKKVEEELEIVQYLWKEDKEHYELAKENIDIINIKCHDLKHQIAAIRNGGKVDDLALKEVEKSVMIYGSIVKTGNDALDVVLTEKSLVCNKHNISLSYIADGDKIKFMSASNIYSLFGNAIDNAVEYLLKVDEEKRFIRLYVKQVKDMASIHIENYFEGQVEFKEGLPKTTKTNDRFHGFGVLSMKKIVESYDGEIFVKSKNKMFVTDILIPLPSNSEK